MDPLSEALTLLRPQTYVLHALDAGGDWAIQFPAHNGVKLDAVLKGSCWLLSDGESEPYRFVEGDCFLLKSGRPFVLASDPSISPVNYLDALSYDAQGIGQCQAGGDCFLVAVHFSLKGTGADRLFEYLPPVVPVSAALSEASVLRWSLDLLAQELRNSQPGHSLTAEHLAHIMLIQVLRLHLASTKTMNNGWLSALHDPQLSAAINAVHQDIGRRWTVLEMAQLAGMSRSSFAAKFRQVVGTTPLGYLTQWRMQIAVDRLMNRETSLARIAYEVGYESEASFSTAFKKIHGHSPRAHRARVLAETPAQQH
ncbi:AraC family transcriptional regulator [Achromobacter sp.]|uniref:AraC family transcriptional regulator n=1 Tax=Achromobacter sp. TaxID=134375 RepID=UPI0028AD923E|nr:AraC family transcriptional regulator [Achromobacter sp.]